MTLVALLALLLLAPPPAAPLPTRPTISATMGGLKGRVLDQRDQPVPGVQVSLTGLDGRRWLATTDGQGEFKAGELPPGEYLVELAKARHQGARYPKVLIKAQAWLLGVAPRPDEARQRDHRQLRLLGPATYEAPTTPFVPMARPGTEKIPMH
jgi:hypothetical protein